MNHFWRVFLLVLAVLVTAASAQAAFRPRISLDLGNDATVLINGRAAIRMKVSNGGMDKAERAQITAERLSDMVANGLDESSIRVKSDKSQAAIYAGENLICYATSRDAAANHTTPVALAISWAQNIRILISMPAITVSNPSVIIPVYEGRKVNIGGAATGPITASLSDSSIASIQIDNDKRIVQIKALKLGSTAVEISIGTESAAFRVTVMKYAGSLGPVPQVRVTGAPAPSSLMLRKIKEAVARSGNLEPGAYMEIESNVTHRRVLNAGDSRPYEVNVKIMGPGYLTATASTVVFVCNQVMKNDKPVTLFYSNSPERMLKYQTLFSGKITNDQPVRLLYHHLNMIGARTRVLIDIINPGPTPATYRIFRGDASPREDPVSAGYVAGLAFMGDYQSNVSSIEVVPAESRLVLVSTSLGQGQTASGILQIKKMEGDEAFVRVSAFPPGVDDREEGEIAQAPNPLLLVLSDEVYPEPAKYLEAGYVVGKHWAFINIGKLAITDASSVRKLYGNYGVTYNISVKVSNPTATRQKVSILFDPTAGVASGVFIIDGKFISAKGALPPDEFPLASYMLDPGEERKVTIQTVPLAGSNYPAKLVVRS